MSVEIWEGALAPEAYRVTIHQDDSDVDLSTVTGASFDVRDPRGSVTTWPATFSWSAPAQTLSVTHVFSEVLSPLHVPGAWYVVARLASSMTINTVRTEPLLISVLGKFELSKRQK